MRGRYGISLLMVLVLAGCVGRLARFDATPAAPLAPLALENPLTVGPADREFLWNQLVDTVDDYFRIEREERVRVVGEVMTEGRISTYPLPGATRLEPWRRDSTRGFERWHSTLQSVRRRAEVWVRPNGGGYSVSIQVFKELEDLDRPEQSTVGSSALRHDGTLVRTNDPQAAEPATLGWISLGRDISLEQQMLAELLGRLGGDK